MVLMENNNDLSSYTHEIRKLNRQNCIVLLLLRLVICMTLSLFVLRMDREGTDTNCLSSHKHDMRKLGKMSL